MGQTRPVTAVKLMIRDSVEEQLDKIQKKKADLAKMSLKTMTKQELGEQKVSHDTSTTQSDVKSG
jgi:SWI/SNF-related matrix-associated actin-dependent regulator of chromatin subfamily A3